MMTEKIHISSFDIRSPKDFLHKLIIPQYDEFLANNSSSRHVLITIILVYHMYEWVHCKGFNLGQFNSKYEGQEELASLFELARKIANGTKHFKPRVSTRTQTGFSSGFSEGFARPLIIELSDGNETSADYLLDKLVSFWREQENIGNF